jgi:hypothetical protein
MEASNREASGQGPEGGAGTAVLEPTDEPHADRDEQEAEHSRLPHLWASRPWPLRILLAIVPPALFGSLCGWVLGESKVAYIVLGIAVASVLQLVVGMEHRKRAEAAARGFVAGAFFGGFILIVNQLLIDTEPKFHLQDPKWQLAIVTAVAGAGLAWLGAGLRGQFERPGAYIDRSRLSPGEFLGMGAGLVLVGSLFLPWFGTSTTNSNSRLYGASDGATVTAFQTFRTLDWLLILAAAAPFILSWIVAREHTLTWQPGEVTMIAGIAAFVLILCNGIILGRPEDPTAGNIEISLQIGYFVGLLASIGLLVAGYLRQALYTAARKPPGVL